MRAATMTNDPDVDSMIESAVQLMKEIMMPTEETETTGVSAQPIEVSVAAEPEKAFDFTQPVATFNDETKRAYHLLRRMAILAKDEKQLPDGKVYTLSEVVAILGEDYAQSQVINARCC